VTARKPAEKRRTKPKAAIPAEALEKCARAGFTVEETATYLGVDPSTIYRHKRDNPELQEAIKKGKLSAHAEVSNKLYEQCKRGNVAAIIWYEKTRRGLTDKITIKSEDLDREIEGELERLAGGEEAGDAGQAEADAVH
jgi:predicted transcriptional regulator